MPFRVAIRADGNSEIGFGHIIRTQALARQLEKCGVKVFFLTINPENVDGFATIKIPGDYNADREDRLTRRITKDISAGILIIDSYAFNQERLDKISRLELVSVYIDDMNLYKFNTTFVVNGNLYAPQLNYRGQAQFLLGNQYLLLREQFTNILPRVVQPHVGDIMLTFGAADMNNLTATILKKLKTFTRFLNFNWHVIIGPAFRQKSDIEAVAHYCNNVILHYNPDVKNLMKICDICISAAGSTTYELAACGLPSIVIVAADNQSMLAEEAHRQGMALNLGRFDRINSEDLYRIVHRLTDDYELRKSMAIAGQKIIDGYGAVRAARTLLNL